MKIKDAIRLENGEYILQKLLNKDRVWLHLNDEMEVGKEFFDIYEKVKSGYPIEYVFKEVEFFSDKFYIEEGVLIPRDDTEVVVEKAIEIVKKLKNPLVVDCCTGSGVIAIEIAKHTDAKVIATDISEKALEVTKKNVKLHNVNVEVKKCNLFCEGGDVLVANPPYVENSHKKPNPYEPDIAFFGGDDGLDIVKNLIQRAKDKFLYAVIEIGYNQKKNLREFLEKEKLKYEFFNDLGGRVRGVIIEF